MVTLSSSDQRSIEKAPAIGEMYDLVRDYVKQETLDPIRGAGRWMAWASVGAVALTLGLLFLMIGLLRLTQAELLNSDSGLTWVPYLIVVAASLILVAASRSRIRRPSLHASKVRK